MSPVDVVTVGESLGLLVAGRHGRLQHVPSMDLGFGGAESNVAIGVARLGGVSAWIGRLGADSLGELITREIRAEGVQVHVTYDAEVATALMLKERPRPGHSRITYYRRGLAGSRLAPADIPENPIRDAAVLHVTGITAALGESAAQAVDAALDLAARFKVRISFDVNHRSGLWASDSEARVAYRKLASRADVIFAGEKEAELLTGVAAGPQQLEALLEMGAREAVVKRGDQGAISLNRDGVKCEKAALPLEPVDTVGAGDAFVAGWLLEWVRGSSPEARMDTAIACGAAACGAEGDWESLPTARELENQLGTADPVIR
ncbi:sugar kinase [Nesterenkonia sp. Act20]|uniref:sugar kinase n=1 Tax=Nesterenkonia sp. Act20 TaxID=1483432 RepID=UPI001C4469D7